PPLRLGRGAARVGTQRGGPVAADDLLLHYAAGTLTLYQAVPPRFAESRDLRAFRAPFGDTAHALGTAKALPTVLIVKGTIRGNALVADDALAELEDALPSVSAIEINGQRIPVMGGGGVLSSAPLLTGWRVTLQFLSHPEAAWSGDTADSTMWTADTSQLTADMIGL